MGNVKRRVARLRRVEGRELNRQSGVSRAATTRARTLAERPFRHAVYVSMVERTKSIL